MKQVSYYVDTIQYPSFLKKEFYPQYAVALRCYFNCIENKFSSFLEKDLKDESFIFWLAIVAYSEQNLTPLINLDKQINLLSDTYYWLYLAHEPDFFYSTVEIEMYRRRISYNLPLLPITETSFQYRRGKETNIVHLEEGKHVPSKEENVSSKKQRHIPSEECASSLEERKHIPSKGENVSSKKQSNIPSKECSSVLLEERKYHPEECSSSSPEVRFCLLNNVQAPYHITAWKEKILLNRITHNYSHNWIYYGDRIKQLCLSIIKAGGVIAGGFVNSLVNPTFFLVELILPHYPIFEDTITRQNKAHYACSQLRKCCNLAIESVSENEIHNMYPGLCDCIRAYFARHYQTFEKNYTPEEQSFLEQDVKMYQDYDLEAALIKYSDRLLVREGKLYFLEFHYSHDIDIFFTGQDYLSKCSAVMNLLLEAFSDLYHVNVSIRCDTYVTTFSGRGDFPSVQLIKRAYNTEEEILAGFDLHSSRVALLCRGGEEIIVAVNAYVTAVNYGLNLVVPSCQSASFNFRLSKYYNRGFEVYLPGDILDRFKLRYCYSRSSNPDTKYEHMLRGLLLYRKEDMPWSRECRDYDQPLEEDNLLRTDLKYEEGRMITFPLDIREREIKSGRIIPQIRDILYLGNRLINNFGYGHGDPSWQGPPVEIGHIFTQYMISLFWKTLDASTQFTGSFNPTKVDYLSSSEKEISIEKEKDFLKERLMLAIYFPDCLLSLILDYYNPLMDIYTLLLEVEAYLNLKSEKVSFTETMLTHLTERGITIK